jgi:hypothetical protein
MKNVWGSLALLAVAGLLFFSPFIFSDKLLVQTDQLNGIDGRLWFAQTVRENHSFPLWWPSRLAGVPTLDATFGDHMYPLILCQFVFPWYKAFGYKMVLTVIIAGLTAFLLFRRGYGFAPPLSVLLALFYMFNTNFISHLYPGHDGKMYVISLLPLALFGLIRLMEEARVIWSAVVGLAVGLSLLTSHIQLTYMVIWGLVLYFIFHQGSALLQNRNWKPVAKRVALFALAGALGLGLGALQFYPPYVYVQKYSVRGTAEKTTFEHATSWSLHPEEVASLVVPEFGHFSDKNNEKPQYWGRNPFKLNSEYPGLMVLLFAILGMIFYRKNRTIVFWWLLALGTLVYALGANTPFFYIFYYLVPGVKNFRAPSMIMFWFALALTVVTGITLSSLLEDIKTWDAGKKAKIGRAFLIGAGACLGFALLCTVGQSFIQSLWTSVFFTRMPPQNAQIFGMNYPSFVQGCWISMALAAAALFLLSLLVQGKLPLQNFFLLLGLIGIVDLWRMDSNHLVETLKKDSVHFRVFDANGAYPDNFWGMHGLESVNGFLDNELSWYRQFRGSQASLNFIYRLQQQPPSVDDNPFLNLMNVKYIVYKTGNQRQPVGILENHGCLPRAFIVSNYQVADSSQVFERLRDPSFPYRTTVLLDRAPTTPVPEQPAEGPAGTAEIMGYTPNVITLKADLPRPGFLVLGDNYFPAWKAKVDGKAGEVYRAYGSLRAIPLAAGKHDVTMYYSSSTVNRAAKIAAFTWILVAVIFGVAMVRGRKKPVTVVTAPVG